MAKVAAVSGATGSEFKALEAEALRLGSSTSYTAGEVAGLQLEFAKLGFTSEEINKVTGATLNLAKASGSDLARSAEVAGATLRGFGMDASETERVTDVMASSFSSTALDMESFAESMKYVAPVANSAGLSLEDTTAMLGTLANAGVKGSQAGTALRRIISELGATGGDVTGAIKKLASEGLNLADAKDEVGRSAQSALLILSKGTAQTDELGEAFRGAKGSAADMAEIMDNTASGGLARMRSAIEGAQIKIGKALAPTIMKLVGFVERLANKFTSLDSATQSTIITVAAIAAAIGPLLMILPQLAAVAGVVGPALGTAFTAMTGPIGLAIAAVAALVGAIFYFWDDVKGPLTNVINYFIRLYNENEGLRVAVAILKTHFVNSFTAMKTALLAVVDTFGVLFKAIGTAFTDGFGAAWDVLKDGFSDIKDDVAEAGEDMYNSYVDAIAAAKSKEPLELVTEEDLDAGMDRIKGLLDFGGVFNAGGGGGGGAAETGDAGIQALPTRTLTAVGGNTGGLMTGGPTLLEQMGLDPDTTTNAFNVFRDELSNSQTFVESLQQSAQGLGEGFGEAFGLMIQGSEDGKEALKEATSATIDAAFQGATAAAIEAAVKAGANFGPFALAAIPALIATGMQLVRGAFQGITGLAEGGIVTGRTLVEVGEYSGVSSNPEVIAPLDKLQGMISRAGGGSVQVQGVLRGKDIYLATAQARTDVGALRGGALFG
jgi:hypothetical protein